MILKTFSPSELTGGTESSKIEKLLKGIISKSKAKAGYRL